MLHSKLHHFWIHFEDSKQIVTTIQPIGPRKRCSARGGLDELRVQVGAKQSTAGMRSTRRVPDKLNVQFTNTNKALMWCVTAAKGSGAFSAKARALLHPSDHGAMIS
jgi:hypothetical protein